MDFRVWARLLPALGLLALSATTSLAADAGPPPLEAYGKLPATENVALSPSGERIALITTVGDQRILAVQTLDGKPLYVANVGEMKVAHLDWAGDDHVVVYAHRAARLDVNFYLQDYMSGLAINIATQKVQPLFKDSTSFIGAIFGRYGFAKIDDHWYGFFGGVPLDSRSAQLDTKTRNSGSFKQRYPNLYRIDLDTGATSLVEYGNLQNRNWAIDAAGNVVAQADYDSDSGNWAVYATGKPGAAATGQANFDSGLEGLGRTPGTVILENSSGENTIRELRLADGIFADPLPGNIENLFHSPSTHLLLGAVVSDDRPRTIMFDPTLDLHIRSLEHAFPGATVALESVSDALDRMIIYVDGPDTSGTYQFVDFKTHRADPLADAYPDVMANGVGPISVFRYQAADGLPLQGILTLPRGAQPRNLPLIVFPHGGPEAHDKVAFDWWAQAMASRGYAVLQPNFRGSSGFGAAFRNAGFGEWGRKMQTDLSDGVAALAAQGIIDPKRACIVGASYGGYAALAGVTLQHGIYRCAASYAGLSDIPALISKTRRREGRDYMDADIRYLDSYLGTAAGGEAMLETISPVNHAKEADAPILLIHGTHDTVVSIEQSETMDSALRGAGKPVEFIQLDGEDHWLSQTKTRLDMLKAVMAFVEKYNPPGPGA